LFCATSDSPYFPQNGYCQRSADNFSVVVKEGRKPGLQLDRDGSAIGLPAWGHELLDQIAPYAALYDQALGGDAYARALQAQRDKLDHADSTPSARLLSDLRDSGLSFHDHALQLSRQHADTLRAQSLPADTAAAYAEAARKSHAEQASLEQNDTVDFDTYVAQYHAALKAPQSA